MGKQVQTVLIPDEKINRAVGSIVEVLNQLAKVPFLDGYLLKDQILLSSGQTIVNHKLGRTLSGYLVLKQDVAASIWLTTYDERDASFGSTAQVTVDLWVF